MFEVQDETKRNFQAFTEEFGVGRASRNFIKRARAIGADEFSVYLPGQTESIGTIAANGRTSSDLFVSRLDDLLTVDGTTNEKRKNYDKHLDRLEANFESLSEGKSKIQVTRDSTIFTCLLRNFL